MAFHVSAQFLVGLLLVILTMGVSGCFEDSVNITIKFDEYAMETSWNVTNITSGNTLVASGGPYFTDDDIFAFADTVISEAFCKNSSSCLEFNIFDASGDGICCATGAGYYNISLNGAVVASGGTFKSSATVRIGATCPTFEPTAKPTKQPTKNPISKPTRRPTPKPTRKPSARPTVKRTTKPTISFKPTSNPTASCDPSNVLNVTIIFDSFPTETSWSVTDLSTNTVVIGGGPYDFGETKTESISCLATTSSCYSFVIQDSADDGICCGSGNGSFQVTLGNKLLASGSEFTSSSTVYFGGKVIVGVKLHLDDFPIESSWSLKTKAGSNVHNGGPYSFSLADTDLEKKLCVEYGCYTFSMYDSGNDGLCCSSGLGSYNVTYNGELVASGGSFTNEATSSRFGVCTNNPTTRPTSIPSSKPSSKPSSSPSSKPSTKPSTKPSISTRPSSIPSSRPSSSPSSSPTRCEDVSGMLSYTLGTELRNITCAKVAVTPIKFCRTTYPAIWNHCRKSCARCGATTKPTPLPTAQPSPLPPTRPPSFEPTKKKCTDVSTSFSVLINGITRPFTCNKLSISMYGKYCSTSLVVRTNCPVSCDNCKTVSPTRSPTNASKKPSLSPTLCKDKTTSFLYTVSGATKSITCAKVSLATSLYCPLLPVFAEKCPKSCNACS